MIFWAITFVICGIIAVFFYLSLIQKAPQITSNSDLEVYKDQLINIDSELTRGIITCLLYTSPSPRDKRQSRMPSSA